MRQVWRWLAQAEETGSTEKPERRRFRITDEIIEVLADHQGNARRAHEHLVRAAKAAGEKPIGLTMLHDAIARDLDPGFMAACGRAFRPPAASTLPSNGRRWHAIRCGRGTTSRPRSS